MGVEEEWDDRVWREGRQRDAFATALQELLQVAKLFDVARMFGVRVSEVQKWKVALNSWSSQQADFPDAAKLPAYTELLRTEYRARGYEPYIAEEEPASVGACAGIASDEDSGSGI